jgi:HEPN domain-containing protein
MHEHEKWLAIAREDLGMAKLALSAEYFSSATYHCQQCAEKSLKGYLSFKSVSIIKTHDLIKLLEQCMQLDRDFQKLYPAIRILNPFSTKFRYPADFDIPDSNKALQAIQYAANVINFVVDKISDPMSDQLQIR